MPLQPILYSPGRLQILNQLKLPHQEEYDEICSAADGWHAIKDMRTRGAPAIAIVAALSLAVELTRAATVPDQAPQMAATIFEKLDYLVTSRPTAVNLADAAGKLKRIVTAATATTDSTGPAVSKAYCDAAAHMLVADVADNEAIGKYGAEWIVNAAKGDSDHDRDRMRLSILTHCNTGSLATAGYGTALGVVRSLHANGSLKHAYCTETRPYYQGSRLTAFELVHDQIPATLLTDSMAAALLRLKGPSERIAAVVVGADRVAANGDTANKIGTYQLAIVAKHHGVKFLVAAPRTTIDLRTPSGADIVIEERPGREMTTVTGPRMDGLHLDRSRIETVSIAAAGIELWNPAFDVTPAELIDGIITEIGVVERDPSGRFDLCSIMDQARSDEHPNS